MANVIVKLKSQCQWFYCLSLKEGSRDSLWFFKLFDTKQKGSLMQFNRIIVEFDDLSKLFR